MKNAIHESLTVTDLGEHLPRFLANPVVRRNIKDCTRQLRRAREGLLVRLILYVFHARRADDLECRRTR